VKVTLPPDLEALVRREVETGRFGDATGVVSAALRLLGERTRSGAPDPVDVRRRLVGLEGPLRRRGVASLAIFGSVARAEAGPDSDVDILIDVDPAAGFSLVDLSAVRNLLESELGRSVDISTLGGLDPDLRDRILREAETVF
jgi:uncharacterized protein